MRQRNRALAAARARFETEHGRVPAEAELAEALGLDVRQYRQYQAAHGGTPAALLSLDAPLETAWSEGDEPLSLADTIAGNTPDPMRSLEESELHAMLVEGLRSLPQRDRVLLSLYYERELTMKEISVVLGVSEPRVCQLHARALQRLRLQWAERPGDA